MIMNIINILGILILILVSIVMALFSYFVCLIKSREDKPIVIDKEIEEIILNLAAEVERLERENRKLKGDRNDK